MRMQFLRRVIVATFLTGMMQTFGQSGSVDPTFNAEPNGAVFTIAVQPDGKILVGGVFTEINGVPRSHLARLNPDGSIDPTWTTGTDEFVYRIVVEPDAKIYVGSGDGIRRFSAIGTVERFYSFYASAFAPDHLQRIVVGGSFTFIEEMYHRRIARFNEDGTLDATFTTEVGCCAGESVEELLRQGEQMLVGGLFQELNQTNTYYNFGRINADSSVDSNFGGYANGMVVSLAFHPDGRIYRVNERALARHFANGFVDDSFPLVPSGIAFDDRFFAVASQPDGKPVVVGDFTLDQGATRLKVARFDENGSHDSSFSVEVDDRVETVTVQPDGRILIGGHFSVVNGVPRTRIARLLGDAPALERQCAGSDKLVLSWPAAYTNHVLQSCMNLSSDGWANVINAVTTLTNGMNCVTNPITPSGNRFFRLRRN